jgi:hypothetical protein
LEIGGSVSSALACCGIFLGPNPDISPKYKVGDVSKGVANTLLPAQKNIQKKYFVFSQTHQHSALFWPLLATFAK